MIRILLCNNWSLKRINEISAEKFNFINHCQSYVRGRINCASTRMAVIFASAPGATKWLPTGSASTSTSAKRPSSILAGVRCIVKMCLGAINAIVRKDLSVMVDRAKTWTNVQLGSIIAMNLGVVGIKWVRLSVLAIRALLEMGPTANRSLPTTTDYPLVLVDPWLIVAILEFSVV